MAPARFPAWGWFGLALVAVCWPLNWMLPGLRTHLLFVPLWLGFILVVDALVQRRTGASLIARVPRGFAALFAISVPLWWLFEAINQRTRNWEYSGRDQFSDLEYALLASACFSTVVPAVYSAAELVLSMRWLERFARGPALRVSPGMLVGFALTGLAMLLLTLAWPDRFYPFVWTSLVFLLEPLCAWLGRPAMLAHLERGDWRRFVALWVGTLACGFFWELWNVKSDPQWTYRTPGVDGPYLFEMPLPGYLGYFPFGLEVYAITRLLWKDAPELEAPPAPLAGSKIALEA